MESVQWMGSVSLASAARHHARVFAVNLMRIAIKVNVASLFAWIISAETMAAEVYVANVRQTRDVLLARAARIHVRRSVARQTPVAGRANVVNHSAMD